MQFRRGSRHKIVSSTRQQRTLKVLGGSSFLHSSSLLTLSRAGLLARRVFFEVGGGFQNTMFTAEDWVRTQARRQAGAAFLRKQALKQKTSGSFMSHVQSYHTAPPPNLAWAPTSHTVEIVLFERLTRETKRAHAWRVIPPACGPSNGRQKLLLLFFFFILRRMGKNKALAHHTSAYFHTRRVSI